MNAQPITADDREIGFESTYALLIHSAEKSRNICEVIIHGLLLLGPIVALAQFAQQPINLPAAGFNRAVRLVCNKQIGVGSHEAPSRPEGRAIEG